MDASLDTSRPLVVGESAAGGQWRRSDPAEKDKHKMPVPVVHLKDHANDRQGADVAADASLHVGRSSSGLTIQPRPPQYSAMRRLRLCTPWRASFIWDGSNF